MRLVSLSLSRSLLFALLLLEGNVNAKRFAKDMTESSSKTKSGRNGCGSGQRAEAGRGERRTAYVEKGSLSLCFGIFHISFGLSGCAPPVTVLSINQFGYEHNTHTPRGSSRQGAGSRGSRQAGNS